jgi:hypothetical protein
LNARPAGPLRPQSPGMGSRRRKKTFDSNRSRPRLPREARDLGSGLNLDG